MPTSESGEPWAEGLVGEKPRLKPGQGFEYVSGTSLPAGGAGSMRGWLCVERSDGVTFEAEIPPLDLVPLA